MTLVPTGGDIDASLLSLRIEFNDIDGVGVKHAASVQIERGKLLIQVRQLLEMKNGRRTRGVVGADGLAPVGWKEWVQDNLTIKPSQAAQCVRYAIHPECIRGKGKVDQARRGAWSIRTFKAAWPRYTDDVKRQIAEFVIAKVREEQAHG